MRYKRLAILAVAAVLYVAGFALCIRHLWETRSHTRYYELRPAWVEIEAPKQ